jgi:hypothetical protein
MSRNSSPPSSPHHIGIIISPVGRFLQCRDCQLSLTFPDGAQFGTVAKRFETHSCSSAIRIPAWHNDRRFFIILRYEGRVPVLASCAQCERKFFTPLTLARDAVGAEEYLGQKFDAHQCHGSD